jgi:hypothetical protein
MLQLARARCNWHVSAATGTCPLQPARARCNWHVQDAGMRGTLGKMRTDGWIHGVKWAKGESEEGTGELVTCEQCREMFE